MHRNIHICMYDYFGCCFRCNLNFIDYDISIVCRNIYIKKFTWELIFYDIIHHYVNYNGMFISLQILLFDYQILASFNVIEAMFSILWGKFEWNNKF